MRNLLLIVIGLFFTTYGIAQKKENREKNKQVIEKCKCITIYFSLSGYGKLQTKRKTKTTTKKGCLNQHKTINKFSGRTEKQIPKTYFCDKLLKKG